MIKKAYSGRYRWITDGVGEILSQVVDGVEKPVVFVSSL